ncbi:MarR family transcriptional regulator [Paenibacillus doosanensis]|uniref:MarR family protein n=1 Tax=Paenibacillus konkukensis TaxID=2020716 RepID=A0ABY4RLQ4_9BACL|nr:MULTISPECIES: MarR family transcriptional regulator [Paenibacillus]MCS7462666.1 MarR family transcriptional regulator [Paenibacillus doosanensis]UQZ82513.1 MarR family protein [Paenibacillus konkukensis]
MLDRNKLTEIEVELAKLVRRANFVSPGKDQRIVDRSTYLLLLQLKEHGPAGVKALAQEFRLDVSTVSRQMAVIEKKGYVRRIADPTDGRASSFQINEAGLQELELIGQARVERYSRLLKDWTPEELDTFAELLGRLNRTYVDE